MPTNPIQIYNSLSGKKELFEPLKPPKVNIYTCGVTVYDDCHIGHARSLYIFDVMRRYLEYKKYKVNFVRNITDIDDKIINRARQENKGEPLIETTKSVTDKYIQSYYKDLESLGIKKADFEPRATENIPEMVEYIKLLIDKGYAYVTNTGVYFSVRKFQNYGQLSHQSIDQMLTGVRKEADETKNDPLDFALWKLSKPDEPKWQSPWGEGRPGWHIECSVMSQKFLKTETLDIHAGGLDLVFPHHENEIAQAEALTGKPFAKYWIHHGLLTINGHKMSKSLGNFVTVSQFLEKYEVDILKLFFLTAHYKSSIDYTQEKIEIAKKNKEEIDRFFSQYLFGKKDKLSKEDKEAIDRIVENFNLVMSDDFNTPRALAEVFGAVNLGSNYVVQDKVSALNYLREKISDLLDILGISPEKEIDEKTKKQLEKLLKERQEARERKDYKRADQIREEIRNKGFVISDTGSSFSITSHRINER
ncbi:MAG: cysteine--tRNA ligase [Candidatus Omnitrophica bacterium]|nr:cysteine--tRNA ligase [Candidatus Omnitrophota bacterium]MDD5351937.1 cysteine--tRNA ligase [Candidatus Omnitrophota bacterium]MDD5550763.1 cysteine--tRNA ligase [Candidatus Omnitrophota bacterium]